MHDGLGYKGVVMRSFTLPSAILCGLFLCLSSNYASACSDHEYRDDFGICWPKGGEIERRAKQVVIESVIGPVEFVKKLSTGDLDAAYQRIGQFILTGPVCPQCKEIATSIFGSETTAELEQLVGKGFVILLEPSMAPIILTYNPVSREVTSERVQEPDAPPISHVDKTKFRGPKNFTVNPAVCIIVSDAGKVFGGYIAPPDLKDAETGAITSLWDTDLRKNDVLTLSSPLCPAEDKPGQKSVATVVMTYENEAPMRGAVEMRYALWGKKQ